MTKLSSAVIKTLAYADIFEFPLKEKEVGKFLISPFRISQKKVSQTLILLMRKGIINKKEAFYYLKNQRKIVFLRKKRRKWSHLKFKKTQKIARLLKIIPWIKAVILTGSLSRENADQEDDIDWLVITSPQRLWLSRFLLIFTLQLLGKRRRPFQKKVKDKICANMFLTQKHLKLPKEEQDLFAAHEILQARLLWQKENSYFDFIKANSWTRKYLANAYFRKISKYHPKAPKLKTTPLFKLNFLFNFLEKLLFLFQRQYMKTKKTIEIVKSDRALFHPQSIRQSVITEHQAKINRLLTNLSP
jgi:predicted nucleotidyltransferase